MLIMKTNSTPLDKQANQRGFALISVLLILVVLTVSVTAFLTNMRIERIAARNIVNVTQAQVAAEAGLTEALIKLTEGLTNYHYVTVDEVDTSNTNYHKPYLLKFHYGTTNVAGTNYMYTPLVNNGTNIIQVAEGIVRHVGYTSLYPSGNTNTEFRYGYWIDEANSKQNVLVAQSKPREYLTNLNELPLLSRDGTPLSSSDISAIVNATNFLLTPQTINQVVPNLNPKADDFDYTFRSSASLLTPEGYPRLNLKRLKEVVDEMPLTQGPDSPRVQLVSQLLDLNGNNPPDSFSNPWGGGSLKILRERYDEQEAKQIVANILDYIDEDLVPTSDAQAGPAPSGANPSGPYSSQAEEVVLTPEKAPTFIGVEAKVVNNTIQGHSYINLLSFGYQFNASQASSHVNSTRVFHVWGIVNPWSAESPLWGNGNSANPQGGFYYPEIQIKVEGSVESEDGKEAPNIVHPSKGNNATDYFPKGWLSQEQCSRTFGDAMPPTQAYLIPRNPLPAPSQNSGADFANGFLEIFNNNVNFSDVSSQVEIARLIYFRDNVRYVVQDLRALKDFSIPLKPPFTKNTSTSKTIKLGATPKQDELHLNGDPRLNFKKDQWVMRESVNASTAKGPLPPPGANLDVDVFNGMDKELGDQIQGANTDHEWWKGENVKYHFPAFSQGYRPSPGKNEAPMQSLAELGFIFTGNPWQTLRLYEDNTSTENKDWRILQYVELGTLNHEFDNISGNYKFLSGQININTKKSASLDSLFRNMPNFVGYNFAELILQSGKAPFLNIAEVLTVPGLNNGKSFDFEKDEFIGRFINALSLQSKSFTLYIRGESVKNNVVLGKAILRADIELSFDQKNKPIFKILRKEFI